MNTVACSGKSVLEAAIDASDKSGEDVIGILERRHDSVRLVYDCYVYWDTVAIVIDNRFFLWHDFYDDVNNQHSYLVEGHVADKTIRFERFQFYDHGKTLTSVDGDHEFRCLGFDCIMELYGAVVCRAEPGYSFDRTYQSGKQWSDPERVQDFFDDLLFQQKEKEKERKKEAYAASELKP